MSADGDPNVVLRGVIHGACDYLLKPVRLEELKNIWQHVVRRLALHSARPQETKKEEPLKVPQIDPMHALQAHQMVASHFEVENVMTLRTGIPLQDQRALVSPNLSTSYSEVVNSRKNDSTGVNQDLEMQTTRISVGLKKSRIVWTGKLHENFVKAVHLLGLDSEWPFGCFFYLFIFKFVFYCSFKRISPFQYILEASPKRVLELMNVPGLTRDHVASHLQVIAESLIIKCIRSIFKGFNS